MADLYLVALSKKRGDEGQNSSLHYLLSKEATRCLPCGEIVCGTTHYEAEQLAECVYYLAQFHNSGEYGTIRVIRDKLKEKYEETRKEPIGFYKPTYEEHLKMNDQCLSDYQEIVNEMDLRHNPFIRFASFVKSHRIRYTKRQLQWRMKRASRAEDKNLDT